ncbi:PAS domain S-box protein [Archangium sp.]|uniref:PAS domain S-box protein n=1 Tax=Archangium sp. TaxID=1872627 RepID=UPI00286B2E83|nr:PAS domain S-box protein [Archangium sp.]
MTPAPDRSQANIVRVLPRVLSVAGLLCVCLLVSRSLDTLTHSAPFPIFLAGIMAAGWYGGFWPALALTVLATLSLDVLFIRPHGSLAVSNPGEAVLLGTFCVVGMLISVAAGTLREARLRAEQLQRLTGALSRAATPADIAEVVGRHAQTLLGAPVTALWVSQGEGSADTVRHVPASPQESPLPDVLTSLARQALRSGAPVWPQRERPGSPRGLSLPLRSSGPVLGALALLLPDSARPGARQRRLALALGDACAVALERALLHEQLQHDRRLLDSVLEQAPVGVIVAEARSSRILLYNNASERILGHPAIPSADVSHFARYGGYHADGSPVAAEEYPTARALLRGEQVRNELMRYRRGDGQHTLLEISAAPVRAPDGTITAAVCVFADVAERQQAEQRLRESEERYRQLFEAAPQIIWMNRPDGSDTHFNSLWYELTGQTREQASTYGWLKAIHPEDLPRLRAQREEGIRRESAYTVEFRVKTARGGDRWLLGRVVPLRGSSGVLEGWLGAAIDIHERKRAEAVQRFLAEASAALSRSLDERETIEQATRLVVPELADWCVVDLNTPGGLERVAVFHPDPSVAAHVEAIRQERPRPGSPSPVLEVFRTGQARLVARFDDAAYQASVSSEEHLAAVRALGPRSLLVVPLVARERVLGTITLLRGPAREPYTEEDLALAQDFSQRCGLALDNAHLLTELQRSLRTRDDFLSSVAHDLRNPLTIITLRADLLRTEVARGRIVPERLSSVATRILSATEEMNSMIDSLVDLVRSEMGQPPTLRRTEVDVGALARGVVMDQRQFAQHHHVHLHTPETPVFASLDEIRVRRIVRNLLLNAVKYTPEGGNIDVRVERREEGGTGWAVLEVQDRGIGIPARDLPHLFERFFRGENVVGRIPGTGLGLFGARQIAEQHGGRIEVRSVEGQGSVFSVWLPQKSPSS